MVMIWPFQSTTARTTCRMAARVRLSANDSMMSATSARSRVRRIGVRASARRPASETCRMPGQGQPAHDLVEARGGDGADRRRHLGAEAAGRDQHEPLGALGELVGELHRHAAAEAVPDHGDPVDAEDAEQVAHPVGVAADAVVGARLVGVAVAEQVGRDHGVAPGERGDDRRPGGVVAAEAVQEQESRSRARADEGTPVPVDRDVLDALLLVAHGVPHVTSW